MANLVDLDEYKEYKGITNPNRDGKLENLIAHVSKLVEHYCNRNFKDYVTNPRTEWFDAKTNVVYLTEFPVIAVDSVNTSTDGGITQTALTEADANNTGYFVDLEEGTVRTQLDTDKFLTDYNTAYRSLEVQYRAGYAETPNDLKLAVLDLVHYYEENEKHPTQALLGATQDNPLPYIANSFPPHIRRILDLYRFSP